jgi:histone-lysine N-methyltransferase ASH1L
MGPQTVLADMAMPETEVLPVLALASTSSFLSSATPPSDASFHDASLSSTPPTSVSPDNVSLASDQDAPTPKAIAVSCKTLDEPQGHPLLALALDAPDTTNAKLSLAQEDTVSLLLANKNLQQQQLTPQSEPQSENTPVFSGELDVEAQLERQLGRESELHVERRPAPGCDSASVQQPSERAQHSTAEHGEREAIAKPTSDADDDLVPPCSAPEHEAAIVVATEPPAQTADAAITGRPRRARASLPTYNLSKLLGTDIHGRRASKGDDVKTYKRRRTVAGTALAGETVGAAAFTEHVSNTASPQKYSGLGGGPSVDSKPSSPASKRAKRGRSESEQGDIHPRPEILTRRATRLSGAVVPSAVLLPIPSLPKRGKKAIEAGLSRCKRELLRLQDTKEFAHVDERPTITTVWSNGKFVDPRTLEKPEEGTRSSKRVKTSQAAKAEEEADTGKGEEPVVVKAVLEVPAPEPKKRTEKKWLSKGLYAGQEAPLDPSACLTTQEKKKLVQVPELAKYSEKPNKTLPAPMFIGLRLLLNGRDFQLPYDICNPLPPGHPKPPSYRTLTKNRFVGEAAQYWKKQKHMDDLPSKCVCKPEDGCAEDCQNRIMLYECDDTNCNIGKDVCSNRPFATLTERTQRGGRFRVGVEVFKTEDRGFGVRSNRCFRPHEIIMEYTGEIITEDECLNRMDTVYKNNEVCLCSSP